MLKSGIVRASGLLCLLLGTAPALAAAHIDATTRNHSASSETVLIAENGVAKLPIIISAKACASTQAQDTWTYQPNTKARAAELAAYLERITGAKFQIKSGAAGPGILLGTIEEFPTPSAAEGLKLYDVYDGRDAYAIRTEGGCIKLLGATDLGVSHAMSRFLTSFGCRWFFSGPAWEVIPKIPKLTFNINETDRPEVLGMSFGYNMGQQYEKTDPDAGEATRSWNRKNLMATGFKSTAGHCAHNVVKQFEKEFEAHPEMRALIKDRDGIILRTGTGPAVGDWNDPKNQPKFGSKLWGMWGQLCVSNPDTQRYVVKWAEEQLDKNPGADMVGCGPDDGGDWCICPECAKLGDKGNQAFFLANVVAKAIQKSHPGKLAGLLAYNWHCDPPDFPLEPNVYVELTTSLLTNTKYGFDQLLELWPTKAKYVGLYDYWYVYDWTRDWILAGRVTNLKYVAEKIPWYIKHGVICMNAESGNSWGAPGLGYYLAIHLMWNSSTDVEALKNDFYEKAFGPAAKEMQAYYELADAANALSGPSFARMCCDDLEAAEKAAAGRPDVLARIELLKEYHVYMYLLGLKGNTELKPEERKKWAFETLKWNYRIRNTYMTFWTFFAGMTSKQWADEFKEPAWNWYKMYKEDKKPDQIPYRDPKPITPEETAQWFQKMKASFGEITKVTEVSFSKKLVAPSRAKVEGKSPKGPAWGEGCAWSWDGNWPKGSAWASPGTYHGPYVMAMASLKGEPLRFSVVQATVYWENSTGSYVLEDLEGKEIARGKTQRGRNDLELKVPSAGVYYFKYNDNAGGSNLFGDTPLRVALVPESPAKTYSSHGDAWYGFYVPKGTKEIQFYSNGGGGQAIGLRSPSGEWAGKAEWDKDPANKGKAKPSDNVGSFFKSNGTIRTIPVKPEDSGKMWTLHFAPGCVHFFNIPTILQFAGDGPIIPEEVAKKDGLQY